LTASPPPQTVRRRLYSPTRLAGTIHGKAKPLRTAELVVHLLGFVGVAVLFAMAVHAVQVANVGACTKHDNLDPTPGYWLAGFATGGFVVGRLAGWFRFHVREGVHGPARHRPQSGVILEGGLVIFLVVAAVLLGYETWSFANGGNPPPITSYVRCAAYHEFVLASLTASGIGFMLSSWLWFPTR